MEFFKHSHNETLRDRFRGALLGLSLAPAALCASTNGLCASTDGLTQPMLKVAAPHLLRYCDSWEGRWDWVRASADWMTTQPLTNPLATVQVLILGDILDMLLCDRAKLSGFTHLADRSMRYDLPTEQQQYYRDFTEISRDRLSLLARSSALAPNTFTGDAFAGDAFAGGLVSALRHLESYALSVQIAAEHGGIAPAIAGFLAGATGGVSSLPVLWQIKDGQGRREGFQRSKVMAIADGLFADWAGMQWAGMQ